MKKNYCFPVLLFLVTLTGCGKQNEKTSTENGVKVEILKVNSTAQTINSRFSGTVEEKNSSVLSFSVMGMVKRVCVGLGEEVRKGQLIATVDPASMQSSYDAAKATLEQAQDAYDRMKKLHDKGSLAEIKWIEVQSKLQQAKSVMEISRKSLNDCRLYAPYSGTIAEKFTEVGQTVSPGTPVVKLITDGTLRVNISVPETEISSVRIGQSALVNVSALSEQGIVGKVVEKGVQANPLSRAYDVKIALNRTVNGLMPGMVTEVSLLGEDSVSAYVIPANILQLDENNQYFVWLNVGGKATKRQIVCGEFTADGVTVTSGLRNGDEIIVEGQQKVCEGSRLKL